MKHINDYEIFLQGLTDTELAEMYQQYMDNPGHMHFTEIFWEANRRGLSLTDLEEILDNQTNA